MLTTNEIVRRKRLKEQQKRIAENIRYRQSMRNIKGADRQIQNSIDSYILQAVVAEQAGEHEKAVRLATEAQRLKQYQASSSTIRSKLEVVQAVSTANRAMANIVNISEDLMKSTTRLADPTKLGEAQIGMEMLNESMSTLIDQSEEALDYMNAMPEEESNEAGEEYLRQIMIDTNRKIRFNILDDTNKKLDRLNLIRTNEG